MRILTIRIAAAGILAIASAVSSLVIVTDAANAAEVASRAMPGAPSPSPGSKATAFGRQPPPNPPHKGEGLARPQHSSSIEAVNCRKSSPPLWGRWPAGQRGTSTICDASAPSPAPTTACIAEASAFTEVADLAFLYREDGIVFDGALQDLADQLLECLATADDDAWSVPEPAPAGDARRI